MARTSVSDVRNTLDTSVSNAAIVQWIEIANTIVDDIDSAGGVTAARLEQIELLVAQHLVSTQDQRHRSESGPAREATFQGETGMGFEGTKYGQQALALDPTGTLRSQYAQSIRFDVVDVNRDTL